MTVMINKTTSSDQVPNRQTNPKLAMAFKGQIRKDSPVQKNNAQLLIRTLVAMLVPAFYIALLGIVAYFTFYHALFGLHFNQGAPFAFAAALYVFPLLSGLCFTALMLRPFIHLRNSNEHELKLHDIDGREFLQFVSLIQQRVNAKFNINVKLSMLPIVSTEQYGLSIKQNDKITLLVGLPLINAMNTQQLAALICHELAHYADPSSQRAYQWTVIVEQWFDDCLQGRDGWKAHFSNLEQSTHNSAYVVAGLIGKFAIIFSDTILRYLHKAFQSLSGATLIELDRNADQTATLLSGSQGFTEGLKLLDSTSKAWQYSQFRLFNPQSLKLADNFVDEIATHSNIEKNDDLESLRRYLPASWNYHRSLHDRISDAQTESAAGIFHLKVPATRLFKNFPALCKTVTPLYYREYGVEFSLKSLRPVANNEQQQSEGDFYKNIIDDYTSATFTPSIVWNVNDTSKLAKMNKEQVCNILTRCIKQFRSQLPQFQDAHIHFKNTEKDVLAYKLLELQLKHGYVTKEQIEHKKESFKSQNVKLSKQTAALHTYSRCIGLRLCAAVSLDSNKPSFIKTLTLLNNLQQLSLIQQQLIKGQQLSALISGLTGHLYSNQEVKLKAEIDIYTKSLIDINRVVFSTLSKLPGDLKGVSTIAGYLQEQIQQRLQLNRDEARKAQDLFALLEEEFCLLNMIITGSLIEYATKNELANEIEPVRLVLKPQFDKSA